MSLTTPVTGGQIMASDVAQLVQVLQQISGGQEKGHYVVAGSGYVTNCVINTYIASLSRNATPVSVTIDQADVGAFGCGTPLTTRLTQGGFQVYSYTSGAQTSAGVGGNYTIQY